MSGAAQGSKDTTKAIVSDEKAGQDQPDQQQQKPAVALEEDDEFEDFPVEGERKSVHATSKTMWTDVFYRDRLAPGRLGRSQWQHTSVGGELGRRRHE